MKKKKIKITPKSSTASKIHIRKPQKNMGRFSHHSSPDSPSTASRKHIKAGFFILGAMIFISLAFLLWHLLPPSNFESENNPVIVEKDLPPTQVQLSQLSTFTNRDTLIRSKSLEQDVLFESWLMQFDLPLKRITDLVQAYQGIMGSDSLKAGHDYHIWAAISHPELISKIQYDSSPYDYLIWGMQDSSFMNLLSRKRESRIKVVEDVISRDLRSSLDANKVSVEILANFEKALAWKVDFFHLNPGDAYSLVYEENYADGKFVETGLLTAAWVRTGQKEHVSYLFLDTDEAGYFDEQARPVKSSFLRSPLKYSRISSHFGIRIHPIDKTKKQHRGTDYAAREGTEIHAVASGTITSATYSPLNGNFIRIDHGQGYETFYLHLQGFATGIKRGTRVQQDQIIGYVGSTGKSTGPHLCFNLKKNGKFIDYVRADLPQSQPIKGRDAKRFFYVRDSLSQYLGKNL